jgi:spoIIIJ-associated protein
MEIEEKKKFLNEITKEFLAAMGVQANIYIANNITSESDTLSVEIETDDSNYLIGKRGINLAALQHLLRIIARKRSAEAINFTVDINGYRENQKQKIQKIAQQAAQEVISQNQPVKLPPMNSFERRLIHLELEKFEEVVTESTGEGEERKVIVKPK